MIGKRLRKVIRKLLLTFCILRKKKYIQFMSQELFKLRKKLY